MRVPEPSPAIAPEGLAQPLTHEGPTYCDLCARKMQPDPETYETSGHHICPICLEDMIYAHDQH